ASRRASLHSDAGRHTGVDPVVGGLRRPSRPGELGRGPPQGPEHDRAQVRRARDRRSDDPNRYVEGRGAGGDMTEGGAYAHLDRLARRYLGRDRYPDSYRFPGEVRRIYRIAPDKVTT